ncbi:MAG: ABC transporter permease [Bryobacteraceae bacterium]
MGGQFISALSRDARYALRAFRNSPALVAIALVSLALGIGLNTAMFNLVSAVLFQPLPVPDPGRLVSVYTLDRTNPGYLSCSYPNYLDYRAHNQVFSGLLLFSTIPAILAGSGDPQDLTAQIVSGNYFEVLGVKPFLGRTFAPQEDLVPGQSAVAVVSYAFWRRVLGGSRRAVGTTIRLNNHSFTVIGVAPRNFHGTNALVNPDFWVPLMMYQQLFPMADWFNVRRALLFTAVGRLKHDVTVQQAQAEMKSIAAQLEQAYPQENRGRTVVLIPLTEALIHPNSRGGFILAGGTALGVSALVLVIACANVGNLLLVRAAARRKEIALRLALGVGRGRLITQLITESTILSLAGGAVALALAGWGRDILWTARPPWMLSGDPGLSLNGRVVAFTLGISLFTGIAFGLAPAFHLRRTNLASELRERKSPWGGIGRRLNARSILVMGQIALSVVALSGAGLFLRSLRFVEHVDPGFDTAHIATLELNTKERKLTEAAGLEFYRQIVEQIRTLPGIEGASVASSAPFSTMRSRSVTVEGAESAGGSETVALIDAVDSGYFQAMRIPLLRGRVFAETDTADTPRVAIVNETMARRFWKGADPIGRRVRFAGDHLPAEVVGVVKDSVYMNLGEAPRLMVYACLRQNYSPQAILFLRTSRDPGTMLGTVRREIQKLDSGVLVSGPETMPEVIEDSLWAPRLGAMLFAAFGFLAAVLTVVGVYGLISYSVGQRTNEMGIRMALGAQPQDVLRLVLTEGAVLIGMGLVLGLLATLTISWIFSSMLFGVSARDPLTLGATVFVLLATALCACVAPALRATRVDPLSALRED